MSNAYAVIKSLTGQVFAVSAEGVRRQVFEGEAIFPGERLETDVAGSVTLQLPNGEELTLGSSATWQAGEFAEADAAQGNNQPVTDLEQAIADGFDPTTQLDPTAAGPGAGGTGGTGGGGHSAVMLSETAQRVEAVTGFATQGLPATSQTQPGINDVSAANLIRDTDVSAPTVSLLIDSGNPTDSITNNGALNIGGIENGATVEYSTDGGKTWSSSFTPVEGDNTVSVRQTDVAGNTSGATTVSFVLDTQVAAPSVSLTSDTGASGSDGITNSGALTIGGTEAGATVEYSTDGGNNWSSSFTPVEGNNTVSVRQTDVAGNTSGATTVSFVLDTQAPNLAISIDPITADNTINASERAGDIITVTGKVTGEVAIDDLVVLSVGTSQYEGKVIDLGNGELGFSINVGSGDLADNTTISASVSHTDAAGNTGSAEANHTYAVDTSAPNLAISIDPITADNTINASERAGDIVTVTGKVTGEVAIEDVVVLSVGTSQYEGKVIDLGNGELGFNINVGSGDLAENTSISASVSHTDAAGNTGSAEADRTYAVDTQAPAITAGQQFTYDENQSANAVIGSVSAQDAVGVVAFRFADSGDDTSADGYFRIDSQGRITLTQAGAAAGVNDFEQAPNSHDYAIEAIDAAGNVSAANVTLSEANLNDNAPQAADDSLKAVEDTPVTYLASELLGNDSDADGNGLTIASVTNGTGGTVVLNADGSVTFTPNTNFNGTADFTYTVSDGDQVSVPATVTVEVAAVNDAPVAGASLGQGTEDSGVVTGQLTASDVDAGDSLSFSLNDTAPAGFALSSNGSWTLDTSDAAYQYLAKDQTLTLQVPFTVTDASGISSSDNLTLVITGTNDLPVAQAASASALEGGATSAGAVANATEGAILTLTVTTTTPGEAVSFNWAFSAADYLPYNDFAFVQVNGEPVELLSSVASVGNYGSSGTQPFNHAFAVPGTYTLVIGVADAGDTVSDSRLVLSDLSGNAVLTSSSGAVIQTSSGWQLTSSGASGQTLIDQIDFGTVSGQLQASDVDNSAKLSFDLPGTAPAGFVLNADGSWTFDAADPAYDSLADGETLTLVIPYRVTDDQGASGQSSLTLTITGTNDAPIASASSAAVDEDGAINGTLSASDVDHGASLAYSLSDPAPAGFVLNADGSWTFNASNAAYQQLAAGDSLTLTIPYQVTDELGASTASTLTLVVGGVNDAPVVSAVVAGEADEDAGPLVVNLLANASDVDRGATLSVANLTETSGNDTRGVTFDAASGTLMIDTQQYGDLSAGQTLTFTYTYDVVDSEGGVTPTSASVSVEGRNDAPVVTDTSVKVDEQSTGTALNIAAPTDIDANDVLTITVTGLPALGQVTLADGTALQNGQSLTLAELQGLKYDGPADYLAGQTVGNFSYSVSDGTTAVVGTVALSVTPVNDAPVANDDLGAISGLKGAYYAYREGMDGPNLSNLAGVTAFIASHQPSATFVATSLNYGNGVTTNLGSDGQLQTFLGADAASLNTDPANSSDAIIQLTGNLELAAGTYRFRVTADDGFSIRVDGVVVAQYDANQGATPREFATVEIGESGAHDIEIVYWDQTGSAKLLVELREQSGSYSVLGGTQLSHAGDSTLTVDEDTALTIDPATLLGNDLDVDGDTLSITAVGNAVNGSVTLLANGQVVFTPASNFNGTGSFTYTVSDGHGGSDTATVTVGVRPVNDAPTTADAAISTAEDTPVVGSVKASDLEGDALTYALQSTAGHGSVALNATTGVYTYTPEGDYNGADTFTVRVSDGKGGYADSVVSLVVTPVNDAPTVQPIALPAIDEDNSLTITTAQLLANAQDADGDTLNIVGLQLTGGSGVLTDNGDGTWTFTPTADWNGEVSFSYGVSDGSVTVANTATLTVTPVNDGPSTSNAQLTTAEDHSVSGTVVAQDPEGNALTYTIQGGVAYGSLLVNTVTGAYTYTPNANYNGTDSFTLRVYDTKGAYADSVVNVAITPVNDAPNVQPITLPAIEEDGSLTFTPAQLLAGAKDVDGDSLSVVDLQLTSGNGALTANTDGGWTFTPAANWNGNVSFNFGVNDGTVTVANSASLAVAAVNDVPTTTDAQLQTDENTSVSGQVSAQDIEGDPLTYTIQSGVAHGSLLLNTVSGAYTYTPNQGYSGSDSFTLRVYDTQGGYADSVVSVAVTPVNDAPDVQPITLPSINEDGSLTFSATELLAGAQDSDGDTLSVVDLQLSSGDGALTDNGNGTWTFTPSANWNGSVGFSYGVSDGTVTVANSASLTVNAVNDAPVAVVDAFTTSEDVPLRISLSDLLANDTDADGDPVWVFSAGNPQHGSLSFIDGKLVFTPDPEFSGTASFDYSITDGHGAVDSATAYVIVNPVNDPTQTQADIAHGAEDGAAVTGNVLNNDVDVDDSLSVATFNIAGQAYTAGATVALSGVGALTLEANGAYRFTAEPNWHGTVPTVTYTTNTGVSSTLDITIAPVNDAPVANTDSFVTQEDVPLTLSLSDLTGNDTDIDGGTLSVVLVSAPQHGTLGFANGDLTFTPDANYSGPASFTYTVSDGKGGQTQGTASVTVGAVADAPTLEQAANAELPAATGLLLQSWSGLALGGGGNGASPATLKSTLDAAGTPDSSATVADAQLPNVNAGVANKLSGLVYLEAGHTYSFSGVADDSLALVVGGTTVATATWGGSKGQFSGDYTVTESGYYTLVVYQHNQDGAGNLDVNVQVDGGVLQDLSSLALYASTADLAGENLRLSELHGADGQGYYQLYGYNEGAEDTAIPLSRLNAALVDGDGSETLAVEIAQIPSGAKLSDGKHEFTATDALTSVDVSGWNLSSLTVTPPADADANFTLKVIATATESTGDKASTSLDLPVTVHAVNDAPGLLDSSISMPENLTFGSTVADLTDRFTGTDLDRDGDALTYSITGGNGNGLFSIDAATGVITLATGKSLDYETAIQHELQVSVSDGKSSANATVTVDVTNLNDNSVILVDADNTQNRVTENAATGTQVGVTALGTDADRGTTISYSLVNSADGRFAINATTGIITVADGSKLDYESAASHTVTVTATSSDGSVESADFTVAVSNLNDNAPAINDATVTLGENVAAGTLVASVSDSFTNTDLDRDGDAITYSITGGNSAGIFVIDAATGAISIAAGKTLDYETANEHVLTVTASDGALFDTANITVNVNNLPDTPPVVTASSALVSETGLKSATDTDTSNVASGKIAITHDSATVVTLISPTTTGLKSGGTDITWSLSSDGKTLTGNAGTDKAIAITIDNQGNYSVSLLKPIDHPDTASADVLNLSVGVKVTDAYNNQSTNALTVQIQDDVPTASPGGVTISIPVSSINVSGLEAGFVNPTSTGGGTSGLTQANTDSDSYIDKINWGGSSGSGYTFTDNETYRTSGPSLPNSDFKVGTLTHNNFPVSSNDSVLSTVGLRVKLTVMIDGVPTMIEHTVNLRHTETPNNYNTQDPVNDDIIRLDNSTLVKQFTVGGRTFEFEIKGFLDPKAGDVVTTIYTTENAASTFDIYAVVKSTDGLPLNSGDVSANAATGADGSVEAAGSNTVIEWTGATINSDGSSTISNDFGTFTGWSDGRYRFEVSRTARDDFNADQVENLKFGYVVIDGDGDRASSEVTVTLNGEKVVPYAPVVNRDAQTTVLSGDAGTESTASLGIDAGRDIEGASIKFTATDDASLNGQPVKGNVLFSGASESVALTSGGMALVYRANADGSLDAVKQGTNDVVFKVTGDVAKGTYSVEMVGTLDQATKFSSNTANLSFFQQNGLAQASTGTADLSVSLSGTGGTPYWSDNRLGIDAPGTSGNENRAFNYRSNSETLKINFAVIEGISVSSVELGTRSFNNGEQLQYRINGGAWQTIESNTWSPNVTINSNNAISTLELRAGNNDSEFSIDSARVSYTKIITADESSNITLSLGATVTDGSGDKASTDFNVVIDPDHSLQGTTGNDSLMGSDLADTLRGESGDDQLNGGTGNDLLVGGAGDDILIGGLGEDQLTGGSGADTFTWRAGDLGKDSILDFNATEGDRIDLRDLLQGENDGNLLSYLRVDTTTSTLQISTTGVLNDTGSNADVTIKLENGGAAVDLSSYGSNPTDTINSLVADQIVKVDH